MDPDALPDGATAGPGTGKADFGSLYDRPGPGPLARALSELDYEIPQQALPVFRALLRARTTGRPADAGPPRVLDLCCSYGWNAALLRHDLTLAELLGRWRTADPDAAAPPEADASFFAARRLPDAPRVDGLDVAGPAVTYARRAGLVESGWVEDLERAEPSASLAADLRGVDLVTVTGGVGYVTERTFARVVPPGPAVPWVAAFVLRVFDYDGITAVLAERGLVTERWERRSFPQRRFADAAEARAAVRDVAARGLDPAGREDTGRYHADLFVSRPPADVARLPLADLLAGGPPAQ